MEEPVKFQAKFNLSCTTWSSFKSVHVDCFSDGEVTRETAEQWSNGKEVFPAPVHGTMLTDFLYRRRADFSSAGRKRRRSQVIAHQQQDHDKFIREVLNNITEEADKIVFYGILRDQLGESLRVGLDDFWLKKDVSTPIKSGMQKLAEIAQGLCKIEREAVCLQAEVAHWRVKEKIVHASKAVKFKDVETVDEKNQRLNSFWHQFHTQPHKRIDRTTDLMRNVDMLLTPTNADEKQRTSSEQMLVADVDQEKVWPKPLDRSLYSRVQPRLSRAAPIMNSASSLGASHRDRSKPDIWKQRSCQSLQRVSNNREDKVLSKFQNWQLLPNDISPVKLPKLSPSQSHVNANHGGISVKRAADSKLLTKVPLSQKWKLENNSKRSINHQSRCASLPQLQNKLTTPKKTKLESSFSLPSLRSAAMAPTKHIPNNTKTSEVVGSSHLPPIAQPLSMPWQSENGHRRARKGIPSEEYLRACEETGVIPSQIPFVSGHSTKLRAADKELGDHDLFPIVTMMSCMDKIEEVDLSNNVLLTEKSLVPLLNNFFDSPASSSLQILRMNQCLRMSSRSGIQNTMDIVVKLLSEDTGVGCLQTIDLSGIPMHMQCHIALCHVICEHPQLRIAQLSDIGLTGKCAIKCIGELTRSSTLQSLDLGWNCFSKDVFLHLGERIVCTKTLRSLSLPNTSGATNSRLDNPIQFFLEQLSGASSLKQLDVSMNRMDFRASLVLEDALENNKILEELNTSHNPLGALGIRSVLRLLSRETSGLLRLACTDSRSSLEDLTGPRIQMFNAVNPGGKYTLDLHRPYSRALLRMIYKTSDRLSVLPAKSFTQLQFSKEKYDHPEKNTAGVWVVPKEGRLVFTFSIENAFEGTFAHIEPDNFSLFLEKYFEMMKVSPGFKKSVPLMAHWKDAEGHNEEQSVILDALARDFRFTFPHMKQLCGNRMMAHDVLCRLLPCLVPDKRSLYLTTHLSTSVGEHVSMLHRHKHWFGFNAQNPTGNYQLNLWSHGDYQVAQQLLLLDRWESWLARKRKLRDISQRGNGSHIRNETYNDEPLCLHSLAEWQLPESGMFQLDYVSGRCPPKGAPVLDDKSFTDLLLNLQRSKVEAEDQIGALRLVSHLLWLDCLQVRELLGIYRTEAMRSDIFVLFFSRITDIHNEKVIRVRFEERIALAEIRNRIGHMAYFPFIQPEQTWFELDFSIIDQRQAANLLFQFCEKESWNNLTHYSWTHRDGKIDPLPIGIPRSWEYFDRLPVEGVFRGVYNCSPEERNFKMRKQLLEAYVARTVPDDESSVRWWAVLTETPEDIIHFLEFLLSRFPSVSLAFQYIDSLISQDGSISLREFEEAMRRMKYTKFDSLNQMHRITEIFRYMDSSGEGQLSEREFSILDLLFQELQLSIKEFVQFLTRTYGDDLNDAWKVLDADGSGEIDLGEWTSALAKVGFFGPSRVIFSFMDKDNGGSISLDEFETLSNFPLTPQEKMRSIPPSTAASKHS